MVNFPLGSCPKCNKRKWTIIDWENKESYVDLEKGEYVPKGTQIKSLICTYCQYRDDSYPKPS